MQSLLYTGWQVELSSVREGLKKVEVLGCVKRPKQAGNGFNPHPNNPPPPKKKLSNSHVLGVGGSWGVIISEKDGIHNGLGWRNMGY